MLFIIKIYQNMKCSKLNFTYLLVIFTSIFTYKLSAQSSSKLTIGYQAKINLSRKSIADTSSDINQQAFLIINSGRSVFFIDTKWGIEENNEAGKEKLKISHDSLFKMQKNLGKNEIICEQNGIGQMYWYRDSLHNQLWTITDSTKQIAEYTCRSATAFFRGRHYTCWFTPEIPLSNGPWKFGGLPGLILEVYDDERKVQFLFQSLKYTNTIANTNMPMNKIIDYQLFATKFKAGAAKLIAVMKAKAMENAQDGKMNADIKIETIEVY
jgi:GLPGLI family protein